MGVRGKLSRYLRIGFVSDYFARCNGWGLRKIRTSQAESPLGFDRVGLVSMAQGPLLSNGAEGHILRGWFMLSRKNHMGRGVAKRS